MKIKCPKCGVDITDALFKEVEDRFDTLTQEKQVLMVRVAMLMNSPMMTQERLELITLVRRTPLKHVQVAFDVWKDQQDRYRGNVRMLAWLIREEERMSQCQKQVIPVTGTLK